MSKFGWSLPAGCGRTPGENEDPEPPYLSNGCPLCRAIPPVGEKFELLNSEVFSDEWVNNTLERWRCSYCGGIFDTNDGDGFALLWADDLEKYLPDKELPSSSAEVIDFFIDGFDSVDTEVVFAGQKCLPVLILIQLPDQFQDRKGYTDITIPLDLVLIDRRLTDESFTEVERVIHDFKEGIDLARLGSPKPKDPSAIQEGWNWWRKD